MELPPTRGRRGERDDDQGVPPEARRASSAWSFDVGVSLRRRTWGRGGQGGVGEGGGGGGTTAGSGLDELFHVLSFFV